MLIGDELNTLDLPSIARHNSEWVMQYRFLQFYPLPHFIRYVGFLRTYVANVDPGFIGPLFLLYCVGSCHNPQIRPMFAGEAN